MNSSLALMATVDRVDLVKGDPLTITATVKNVSSDRILVFAQGKAYTTGHVKLRASNGGELRSYILLALSLKPPSRDDLRELLPGAHWTMSFRGLLRESRLRDIRREGQPEVQGLFLDFEDSAIHIPAAGRYDLTVEFDQPKGAIEYLESVFHVVGLWYGRLQSNNVPLEIRAGPEK